MAIPISGDVVRDLELLVRSGHALLLVDGGEHERLRALIDKWIPDDELLRTTASVYSRGWHKVKLYFMIGHPTETDEDVEAILLEWAG